MLDSYMGQIVHVIKMLLVGGYGKGHWHIDLIEDINKCTIEPSACIHGGNVVVKHA